MKMSTFRAYLKKERLEAFRQYRYVILAVGIIAFAILEPFMLKILPKILQNQFPGDISSLFSATPKFAVNNYIKDLTQIGYLFVIFTLSGILSEEIIHEKFVFPYSQGANPTGIVLAKAVHYAFLITLYTFIGFAVVYYYGGMILEGQQASFLGVMQSALCVSIYYFFNLSLIIFLSSIIKRSIVVGFTVIFMNVIQSFLIQLENIGEFIPNQLIIYANNFSLKDSALTIFTTFFISIVFILLGIYRMQRVEVI